MENEELICKIKSIYILEKLFNYIQDNNFKDKLFLYSKKFQNKLKLTFIKENYLKKVGFDIDKYLYIKPEKYEKNILYNQYMNFLNDKRISKENIEKIIYYIYENKKIKDMDEEFYDKINENYGKLINIDSPLFKIISQTNNFYKYFTIHISRKNIEQNNLKEEYLKAFDSLNKSNKIYSIDYLLDDILKINYLKELNINNINRLTLHITNNVKKEYKNDIIQNNQYFFNSLFSINNIENNLTYLKIDIIYYLHDRRKINSDFFENINNFKSLNYLYINALDFDRPFTFKLNKLRVLSIHNCNNVNLSGVPNNNLEILDLFKIPGINLLEKLKYKKLKKLRLSYNEISNIKIFENLSFKELKELNLANNEISDINVFEKVEINELEILDLSNNQKIKDINILEKDEFKKLKQLNFYYNKISDINIFEKVKFNKLELLNLSLNNISDINILEKTNFKELKNINLGWNEISNIEVLQNVEFDKLEVLELNSNRISDINILKKVYFKELKKLNLSSNQISDIEVLENVKFYKLEFLDLCMNQIKGINIFQKVNLKELKILNLSYNQISDIKGLENINFKELKSLNLSHNNLNEFKISTLVEIHKNRFKIIYNS